MNCVILQIQKKSNGIKGSPWAAGALSWACLVGSARERVKGLDPAHREAPCLWAGLGTSRARDAVPRRIPESFFPGRRERPPGGWRSGESGLGATNGTSGAINTQSSAVLAPGLRAGGLKAGLSPGLTAHCLLSVAAFEGRLGYSRKSSVPRFSAPRRRLLPWKLGLRAWNRGSRPTEQTTSPCPPGQRKEKDNYQLVLRVGSRL